MKKRDVIRVLTLTAILMFAVCLFFYYKDYPFNQKEFKLFKKKFGNPGTEWIPSRDDPKIIGYWKLLPRKSNDKYILSLSLSYDVQEKKFTMAVKVSGTGGSSVMPGDPEIRMTIPMSEFESIMKNGLPEEKRLKLFSSAEKEGWTYNKDYHSGRIIDIKYNE